MAGNLQPLDEKFEIVGPDGRPTLYFIKWCQQRQIDITEAITLLGLENYLDTHPLQEGSGIQITPDGSLKNSPTIAADVQEILDQISTTRGTILYRGATDWLGLAPGAAGEFLKTNGAGADPAWAAGGGAISAVAGATVATSQNQNPTSPTYADLATAGPAVNLTTGTSVIITISSQLTKTSAGAGNTGFISFAVSGATTLAAADGNGAQDACETSGFGTHICRRFVLGGLTAGSNTFTMKYRSDGGIWSWFNRSIVVEAL